MAYDNELEARIERLSLAWPGFQRKKMFGGVGWLFQGNMAFGILKDSLVVRSAPEAYAGFLARPGVGEFAVTGRPMKGWLLVAPEAIEQESALLEWLEIGRDFAATLAAKD